MVIIIVGMTIAFIGASRRERKRENLFKAI
jgi:hypothetical protein